MTAETQTLPDAEKPKVTERARVEAIADLLFPGVCAHRAHALDYDERIIAADPLTAQLAALQAVATAAKAYRDAKDANTQGMWREQELYDLGVVLDAALDALARARGEVS